eukprot:SM000284S10667  [mRNA]  locus=s284:39863:42803:- [translate_table: standard]
MSPHNPCSWATIPGDAVVMRLSETPAASAALQRQLAALAANSSTFRRTFFDRTRNELDSIFRADATGLVPAGPDAEAWLGADALKALRAVTSAAAANVSQPFHPRWCASSAAEFSKCQADLVPLLNSLNAPNDSGDALRWACVEGRSADDCAALIAGGDAEVTGLDALAAVRGAHEHGLVPLAAEGGSPSTTAVAIVRATACEGRHPLSPGRLRGLASCHADYGSAAGWTMPLGRLAASSELPVAAREPGVPDDVESAAAFFGTVCAPGGPPALCTGCGGDCRSAPAGRFSDDDGAMDCLMNRGGEVAFVSSSAPTNYARGGRLAQQWATLAAADLRFGTLPERVVMTRATLGKSNTALLRANLKQLSRYLGIDQHGFGPAANPSSLLFSRRSQSAEFFLTLFLRHGGNPSTTSLEPVHGTTDAYLLDAIRAYYDFAVFAPVSVNTTDSGGLIVPASTRHHSFWPLTVLLIGLALAGGGFTAYAGYFYLQRLQRHGVHKQAYAFTRDFTMDDD